MSLADRVRNYRERKDWQATDLSEHSGVHISSISRIEAGKTLSPGPDILRRLAKALDVTIDDLLGDDEPAPSLIFRKGVVLVPYVRRAVHAGPDAWQEAGEDRTPMARDEAAGHKRLYAARIVGDCMIPDVYPGATVIWDPDLRHPSDGQTVVVSLNGDLLVKLAYRDGDSYLLVSNDGQEVRPNGYVLEGVVVKISSDPRRGPRSLTDFREQRNRRHVADAGEIYQA